MLQTRSAEAGVGEATFEFFFRQVGPVGVGHRGDFRAMTLELRERGEGLVPGADAHAFFAAETPAAAAFRGCQIVWQGFVRFDGEI